MSTMMSGLIAIISIVSSQTYDDCGSTTYSVGNGGDIRISLGNNATNSMVKITLEGPTDKWQGVVFGSGTMSGYAVLGVGSTSYAVEERTGLAIGTAGALTSPSGSITSANGSIGQVILERPYASSIGTYDFTNLMTCQETSIDIALALGNGLPLKKHGYTKGRQTLTNECCTSSPTEAPSSVSPSKSPTSMPSVTPSTSMPSVSPSTPSPDVPPSTAFPTLSPSADTISPSVSPSTGAPTEAAYEICAQSQLISNVTLAVYRDSTNEKIKIKISGANNAWFGYGFGTSKMIGSYAVTIEGSDSSNLAVVQRELKGKSVNTLGSILSGGTTSVNIESGIAVGVLEMDYDSQISLFDFTDFMTCVVDEIPLIAAIGSSTVIDYHAKRIENMTLKRLSSCTCDDRVSLEPTLEPTTAQSNIFNPFYGIIIGFLTVILL